jgi:hypothetical protein
MFGRHLVPHQLRAIRVYKPRHTETCKRLRPIERSTFLPLLTRLVKPFFGVLSRFL